MAYKEFSDLKILQKELAYQKSERQRDLSILFISSHMDQSHQSVLKDLSARSGLSMVIQLRGDQLGDQTHHLDPLNHNDRELLIKHKIDYFCNFDLETPEVFKIQMENSFKAYGLQQNELSTCIQTFLSCILYFQVDTIVFSEKQARQFYLIQKFMNGIHSIIELHLVPEVFDEQSLRYFDDYEYIFENYADSLQSLSRVINSVIKNCRGISKDLIQERMLDQIEDEGFSKISILVYDPMDVENEFILKSTRFHLKLEIGGQLYVDDRAFFL